jgi:hypothetical protein
MGFLHLDAGGARLRPLCPGYRLGGLLNSLQDSGASIIHLPDWILPSAFAGVWKSLEATRLKAPSLGIHPGIPAGHRSLNSRSTSNHSNRDVRTNPCGRLRTSRDLCTRGDVRTRSDVRTRGDLRANHHVRTQRWARSPEYRPEPDRPVNP